MIVVVGARLFVTDPTTEVQQWCNENLVIPNPEYAKKKRMGFWTGNIPRELVMYEVMGDEWVIPYGCLRELMPLFQSAQSITTEFVDHGPPVFSADVPLYDYQQVAVEAMISAHYGILRSPAGSGKTQMGIALAGKLGVRTLWLTHTIDLLNQSRDRAAQYVGAGSLGIITSGKVFLGKSITFATVQTMCRLDLTRYANYWDCIIVDECHRVAGTPTAVTQFAKVLNALCARHKYGLSATVHRADGLIRTTYALLGQIAYTVPDEAVTSKTMQVSVYPFSTGIGLSAECLNSDGTLNYNGMIQYLTECEDRNQIILSHLVGNENHFNLILSTRIEHLEILMRMLPPELQAQSVMITGKMTTKAGKAQRQQAIEDMRAGRKRYLFATYSLAKEGLDIPRLDRLYLTVPQKDYAVIVQSVGRIARTFEGKGTPLAYDYVDTIRGLQKAYKQRLRSYKSAGCKIL
jgi:superfamily II DNA or RNA helicase